MNKFTKRLLSILLIGLSFVFLVSCGKKTYSLTLPNEISANYSDLTSIAANSEIVLTVHEPEAKLLDKLVINGKTVLVTNNTYSFIINGDTTVEVRFKDEFPHYSLTLPENVSADVVNLKKIKENSEVELTVSVPRKKELDYLKINGIIIKPQTNTYTFFITSDTVVEVSFCDPEGWNEATFEQVVSFFATVDEELIRPGNLKVTLNSDQEAGYLNGIFTLDEDFEVSFSKGEVSAFLIDEQIVVNYYSDETFVYAEQTTLDLTGNPIDSKKDVYLLNIGSNIFELFGSELDFLPQGSPLIGALLGLLFSSKIGDLKTNYELLNLIRFETKAELFKIVLSLDKADLINFLDKENNLSELLELIPDLVELSDEFSLEIEIVFKNGEFHELTIYSSTTLDEELVEFDGSIEYTEELITPPADLAEYDTASVEPITYQIHFGALQAEEIIISKNIAETLIAEFGAETEVIELLELFNNSFVSGFYIDSDYQNSLTFGDLLTDDLNIYIEWKTSS